MARSRAICLLLLLCVVAMLVGACSDEVSRETDYIKGVRSIDERVNRGIASLGSLPAPTAANRATYEASSARIDAILDDAVRRFAALEPPSKWREEHAQATKALQTIQIQMGIIDRSVKAGDLRAAKSASARLGAAADSYADAMEKMRRDG